MPHSPLVEQTGWEFGLVPPWGGQALQLGPHCWGLWSTQVPPQRCCPAGHSKFSPHTGGFPEQVVLAPALCGQGVHRLPQVAVDVLLTHWPLHKWKPAVQVMPHTGDVPAQVLCPWGSVGQGEQEAPQLFTLLFATQLLPHGW